MNQPEQDQARVNSLLTIVRQLTSLVILLIIALISYPVTFYFGEDIIHQVKMSFSQAPPSVEQDEPLTTQAYWSPPNIDSIKDDDQRKQVEYGKQLIMHTSRFLGPDGSVMQITNGMNCQNCHLQAGTKIFGNNYSGVASTYPKFRARSGTQEDIYKRVNDCIERSLNGKSLDTSSREMQAIKAYIVFIGSNVEKGIKPDGAGLKELPYLDREADTALGKVVFDSKCASCHQPDGHGLISFVTEEYTYPPLWGMRSYNDGAGLYRLSNFARYVKYNMPLGATHERPQLTDEESWDVAAFVNSKYHPHLEVPEDWPDISLKPVDHPYGPFADTFSEKQHKYGPFKPILEAQKNRTSSLVK